MMTESFHEEETLGKAYDGRLVRRLLRYIWPHRNLLTVACVLSLVVTALQLVGPYLVKITIDDYLVKKDLDGVRLMALVYGGTLMGFFFVEYWFMVLIAKVGQAGMKNLRMEIFRHIQTLSLRFFDRNPVGRLMTRVTSDVQVLNELFTSGIIAISQDVVLLLGIFVIMLFHSWKLTLVICTTFPLLYLASRYFRENIRDTYRQTRTRLARMNSYLQENISGMRTVQVFGREEKQYEKFDKLNAHHLEAQMGTLFHYALFIPLVEVIAALGIGFVVYYGGFSVIKGQMSVGTLSLFILYLNRFFQPIKDLSEKYNILQAAMASSERIFKLLDTKADVADPAQPKVLPAFREHVEFRDVSFGYDPENLVLRNVSFFINRGEKVAIVGATGAGKSTVINLVCRFYDVTKGIILLDGVDLRELEQKQLRRRFAVVPQEVYLFSGDILGNLRLGRGDVTEGRVREIARYLNADPFISKLQGGYQAQVRERGATLSVGQKQLLALTRAMVFNPELLILDEATANIDTETELLIQDALAKLMEGRTSVIIAHRLSTIQKADKILVFHHGRLREQGTHQELLAKEGIYRRLYELQFKSDLAEEAS
ncbi:MAG: ABC transporter ATP-binding protein [bacterium]